MSALREDIDVIRLDDFPPGGPDLPDGFDFGGDESAGRRSLRAQISRLEKSLSDAFVTAFSMGGLEPRHAPEGQPRLLGLGELERVRDDLADRLRAARIQLADRADTFESNRLLLERMLLEPAKYRYSRVALADLGELGCGAYEVKPRMGIIGMLAGWWHVKISSGCPLPRGRGGCRDPQDKSTHATPQSAAESRPDG
jgi:hypothetical protein